MLFGGLMEGEASEAGFEFLGDEGAEAFFEDGGGGFAGPEAGDPGVVAEFLEDVAAFVGDVGGWHLDAEEGGAVFFSFDSDVHRRGAAAAPRACGGRQASGRGGGGQGGGCGEKVFGKRADVLYSLTLTG